MLSGRMHYILLPIDYRPRVTFISNMMKYKDLFIQYSLPMVKSWFECIVLYIGIMEIAIYEMIRGKLFFHQVLDSIRNIISDARRLHDLIYIPLIHITQCLLTPISLSHCNIKVKMLNVIRISVLYFRLYRWSVKYTDLNWYEKYEQKFS